ncbi:MAG: hypothetical protein PW734_01125 [Verrucomicrobium sp.]|nr:hypothetical protein [Verrucomicrobium sp.]
MSHRHKNRNDRRRHRNDNTQEGWQEKKREKRSLQPSRPSKERKEAANFRKEEELIKSSVSESQYAPPTSQQKDKEKMSLAWERQEEIWNSSNLQDQRRCEAMRLAVRENLARRWQAGLDVVKETTPAFPGLYLSTVEMTPIDRSKMRYRKMTDAYVNMKFLMDRAVDENPHARALALLAMGPGVGGEQQLREGTVPKDWNRPKDGTELRVIPQTWNRHHEFQKSAKAEDHRSLNDPTNLLYILTEKDPVNNPHHALHGAILHPQTDFPTGQEPTTSIPVAIVKSTVPFYPPLRLDPANHRRVSYKDAGQLMADLERMEPGITREMAAYEKKHNVPSFQSTWAQRVVAISEIARRPIAGHPEHRPFQVLPEFLGVTQGYSDIYSEDKFDKDGIAIPELQEAQRRHVAKEAEQLAAKILPAGVHLNGHVLPPEHKAEFGLPVRAGAWQPLPEFEQDRASIGFPSALYQKPAPLPVQTKQERRDLSAAEEMRRSTAPQQDSSENLRRYLDKERSLN